MGGPKKEHQRKFLFSSTDSGKASITSELTNIAVEVSVESSGSSETFPKHMVVEWIIKIE